MKNKLSAIILIFLSYFTQTAYAWDFEKDGIDYNFFGKESVEVDGFNKGGVIEIPEEVENEGITYQVVAIDRWLVNSDREAVIENLIIPESVEFIMPEAFNRLEKLVTVTLPGSIDRIPIWAFGGSGIETIHIPGNISIIEDNAFSECASLRSVTFDEGIDCIGNEAFRNCPQLREIEFPGSLYSIGRDAFVDTPLDYVTFKTTNMGHCPMTSYSAVFGERAVPFVQTLGFSLVGGYNARDFLEICPEMFEGRRRLSVRTPGGIDVSFVGDGAKTDSRIIFSNRLLDLFWQAASYENGQIPEGEEYAVGLTLYFDYGQMSDAEKTKLQYVYNGHDVTEECQGGSFRISRGVPYRNDRPIDELPYNWLEITVNDDLSVNSLFTDESTRFDVYTLEGCPVGKSLDRAAIQNLPAGLYIVTDGSHTLKLRK